MAHEASEFLDVDTSRLRMPRSEGTRNSPLYAEVIVQPDGRWASDDGQTGVLSSWAGTDHTPRFVQELLHARAAGGWELVTMAADREALRLVFRRPTR